MFLLLNLTIKTPVHFSLDQSARGGKQKSEDRQTEAGSARVWARGRGESAPAAAAGLALLQQVQAGPGEQGDFVSGVRPALHSQVPAYRVHEVRPGANNKKWKFLLYQW